MRWVLGSFVPLWCSGVVSDALLALLYSGPMDITRLGERACFVAVGFLISDGVRAWDGPRELIPFYVAMGAAIIVARVWVVSRRGKSDRERLAS